MTKPRLPIGLAVLTTAILSLVVSAHAFGGGSASKASTTFVEAVPGLPTSIDYPYQGDPSRYIRYAMGSTLVKYDPSYLAKKGCTTLAPIDALVGDLASKWVWSKDHKTITFTLRPAKSPYGHTLTAADVVYSFQRMNALEPITKFQFFQVANYATTPATAVNKNTVQIHLARTNALAVVIQTIMLETIVDSTEVKSHATADDPWATKWMANHTADFGPWKLDSFNPGQKAVFSPNPNYTGKRGNIKQLVLLYVPDPSTRTQLLQSGSVDWAERLPFQQFASLKGASGITTKNCVSPNRDDMLLQEKDPILAKVDVRHAISLAINRNALVKGAYSGFGAAATSGVSSFYSFPKPKSQYAYNVAQAKQLLAKAGYPDGFNLTLSYSISRPGPWAQQLAVLIQSMLGNVGIKVTLDNIASPTDFTARFTNGNYQALLYTEPPVFPDPAYSASTYSLSTAPQDSFNFKDPKYDFLVNTALHTQPGKARNKIISEIASLGVTDYPIIYLVDEKFLYAYRSNVKGFLPQPFGNLLPDQLSK
ncbi:MAG TPA: ABC transporter substrate-binding protein [Gaiellaceae bacterium]|jgi:peptide/nickel transport system substrate-binding protein|nr:ABC transporter substrate-binding protein [Gaiellaceae bacterium]